MLKYHYIYTLNFIVTCLIMKLASWVRTEKNRKPPFLRFMFSDPLLSTRPRFSPPPKSASFLMIKMFLCLFLLFLTILMARIFLVPLNYFDVILISPMVYFLTEAMSAFGELFYYVTGKPVTPMHDHPLTSKSLSEFWGHRWNQMVQDWFKDIRGRNHQNLTLKLITTFFISGLFHEIMINLPYYLCYQKFIFGNMMLYFAIQGLGLWIEKKWLRHASVEVKRLFLWTFILLPSPLFVNEAFLTFFRIN